MYTYFMILLLLAVIGQIVGAFRGWTWSKHVGSFTVRHWSILGFVSGFLAWLFFHWVIAMAFAPGLTGVVVIMDAIVFVIFFAFGTGIWFLRQSLLGDDQ